MLVEGWAKDQQFTLHFGPPLDPCIPVKQCSCQRLNAFQPILWSPSQLRSCRACPGCPGLQNEVQGHPKKLKWIPKGMLRILQWDPSGQQSTESSNQRIIESLSLRGRGQGATLQIYTYIYQYIYIYKYTYICDMETHIYIYIYATYICMLHTYMDMKMSICSMICMHMICICDIIFYMYD